MTHKPRAPVTDEHRKMAGDLLPCSCGPETSPRYGWIHTPICAAYHRDDVSQALADASLLRPESQRPEGDERPLEIIAQDLFAAMKTLESVNSDGRLGFIRKALAEAAGFSRRALPGREDLAKWIFDNSPHDPNAKPTDPYWLRKADALLAKLEGKT